MRAQEQPMPRIKHAFLSLAASGIYRGDGDYFIDAQRRAGPISAHIRQHGPAGFCRIQLGAPVNCVKGLQ